jgi:protein-L-isoaspartate(D-aspartate) O-methyltransferase
VFERTNETLIRQIETSARASYGQDRDPRVLAALRQVDRAAFLPSRTRWQAYSDVPVPIGHEQTCSQPSLVAFLLDELALVPGAHVLEVGAGCGYAAALAAVLCGPNGHVTALERLPHLAEFARENCARFTNVEIVCADGSAGFSRATPFDRIFLSAGVEAATFREGPFLAQLKPNGRLLYPEALGSVHVVTLVEGGIHRQTWGQVVFVPLVTD